MESDAAEANVETQRKPSCGILSFLREDRQTDKPSGSRQRNNPFSGRVHKKPAMRATRLEWSANCPRVDLAQGEGSIRARPAWLGECREKERSRGREDGEPGVRAPVSTSGLSSLVDGVQRKRRADVGNDKKKKKKREQTPRLEGLPMSSRQRRRRLTSRHSEGADDTEKKNAGKKGCQRK
ncbi:hypothetical protein HPB48_020751 [Haemaphysalis longicornis]|uniref:Uncharacterized protein n=1 Tax=Haemaphysalis longicornis TaxID=44386 RepID=A0A9J6H231_HAELO|nr:hypothetical protein HPB48_020751 [Haemaphysalis longicornis]